MKKFNIWNICKMLTSILVKQVFKDMDFLGWYTTGDAPNESDIHVHKQM